MMLHGDLPPVGNPISLISAPGGSVPDLLDGHQYWLDSGTSALALALLDVRTHFPDVNKPRVIIPGYCCPDLVAACVYADVEPVAVDISVNDPAYDLKKLRFYLDVNVIAVIAVNFLGMRERLPELRQLITELGSRARLIEDNAQWFPAAGEAIARESDYVTFSFGRGKPMSLLGGGLLCARAPVAQQVLAQIRPAPAPQKLLRLKIIAYNMLLSPPLYLLLNRNPLLQLGQTKYVPLTALEYMDDYRRSLIESNFQHYSSRSHDAVRCFDEALQLQDLQHLDADSSTRRKQLLRYPLVCADAATRDSLLASMRDKGLGATALYALPIDQISGVNGKVFVAGSLDNATSFAERFMTLPVHAGVTRSHLERILAVLAAS